MVRAIVEINGWDFELPADHRVEVYDYTKLSLSAANGESSSYALDRKVTDPDGSVRYIIDHAIPPTFIIGHGYPITTAMDERNRLRSQWDERFGDTDGFDALRAKYGNRDSVAFFSEVRSQLP